MSLADFNFEVFGKKNGPEKQFWQWLCDNLKHLHKDAEETKELITQLRQDHQVHIAQQDEQWKAGCSPVKNILTSLTWIKPLIIMTAILGAVHAFLHYFGLKR